MNWSLKSIGYWFLLISCLTIGVLLVGAFLLLWSIQINFAFSRENVVGLFTGVIFLTMFFLFYENRVYFPLKKSSKKKEEQAPDKIKAAFYPQKIELNTNLHGLPVTYSCGAPSSVCMRAIQINPNSGNHDEDYEKTFYNHLTGEIVAYDETKPDHRELNEHFLWMLEMASKPNLPKPYLKQYNIIEPQMDREKRVVTLH